MDYLLKIFKLIIICISLLLNNFVNNINNKISNNIGVSNDVNITNNIDISHNNNINNNKIITKDVLFINGCDPELVPHPFRYRVLHQMEQLSANFIESDTYFYLNFEPSIVRNYRVIIIFRCPLTQNVEEAIKQAKRLNKKILYDIDDLVFDTKYTNVIPYVKALSVKEKKNYDGNVISMGKTLKLCEGAITTTDALAKELSNYISNVFINRNVASEEMWKLSQNALINKVNKKILYDIDDLVFDTKYTNIIPYVKALSVKEKENYDSGVILMGKTLKLCEGAITTTDALAKELRNYISNVFINRNVASEEMWKLSQNALINKVNKKKVII